MLSDHPTGGKNNKIHVGHSRGVARRSQYSKDGRIRMIKTHRIDGIELTEVIFERDVVSMPSDDVQRRMA